MKLTLLLLLSFSYALNAQLPGSLNPMFSENGWDTLYGNNNGFEIKNIVVQTDNKIIACAEGNFSNEGHQAILIRYNPDGSRDMNFGGADGIVKSSGDGIGLFTRADGMALQSSGKIIIAGDQLYDTERIFRLNVDGTKDITFGTNGVININRSNSEFIYHAAVQSDDKIIICGKESRFVSGDIEPHVFLWRFTANGIPDSTFGTFGVVSYNSEAWLGAFETYLKINDLIILPNDQILINQTFTKNPFSFVMLSKFNSDGMIDQSFGVNGHSIKSTRSNDGNYTFSSSVVNENGSIISTSTIRDTVNSTYSESIFRVNDQGQIDPSFNISINQNEVFTMYNKLAISGNVFYYLRKITDGAQSQNYNTISCFDLNGNIVNGFGTNGVSTINQNNIPLSVSGDLVVSQNGSITICEGMLDPINTNNTNFLTYQIIGAENNVSINEKDSENKLIIYPNPAYYKSSVNIAGLAQNEIVEIRDINGRIIKSVISSNEQVLSMDFSEISAGVYFVKVGSKFKKLILQ